MAKMIKKMMALLIVLSMCISMVAIPTAAEDNAASGTVTVITEITDEEGNVIGTMITETNNSETEDDGEYTQSTDVNKEWNTQQTEGTAGEPVQNGNSTTHTDTTIVTDVTGTEEQTDNIHADKTTGIQTYTGEVSGSEDTTITDTTTTVTITTGALLEEVTEGPTTIKDGEVTEGEWGDLEQTGEGQWQDDNANDKPGTYEKIEGTENTVDHGNTDIDVDDPLNNKDITLEMKPGKTDEEELFLTIEEAMKNNISYQEGTQADGSVVTYIRDKDGNVTGYKITRKTQKPGTPGDIEAGTPGEAEKDGAEVKTYIKPEGYTPGVVTSEDGNVVTTTEEIRDSEGNVIGYRITEVTTQTGDSAADPSAETDTPAPTVRTLPEKPVAPEPVTENGRTTTVVVTDIIENGEIVGYKTTTIVTDEDGNEISSESRSIYGTVTSYTSTTEKTPETDVVTTTRTITVYGILTTQNYTITTPGIQTTENIQDVAEDIYQLVQTDEGLFFLYQGKMYKVTEMGTHGNVEMESLQPNIKGLEPSGGDYQVDEKTLLRNPENFDADNGIASGYELEYVGYGLETAVRVDKNYETGAGEVLVHQFILTDRNGNKHYVLCADLGTNAVRGADYNMVNVGSADYYVKDGAAEKIEAIALSGYWGAETGVGSLDAVKEFLKENTNLTQAQIDALKPGEALTATQAAIWFYGNSDESKNMNPEAITGRVYRDNGTFRAATADEAIRINALYQALIGLDPDEVTNNTTEFLDKDNFATETELVIKEKATDANGNVKTDANGNEKYVTDLTFSLDVEKSDLTGNLKIKITDEYGNVLHTADLKTDDSNLIGKVLADGSAGSTYTIKDLELAEGVKITLNLSGTQDLAEGVYLYSAAVYSTSQTFVGIASGERDVNLSVDMQFTVTDPEAQVNHTTNTWSEKETDQESFTKTDSYKQEKEGTETTETVTVNTKTYGTIEETDVTTKQTDEHREWRSVYEYQLKVINDEDGGGGGESIEDEDVPLAAAPKTGDITVMMAVVSLFSAGGLVVLNRKREDDGSPADR